MTPSDRSVRGTAAIELVVGVALIMVPMAMVVLSFAPLLEARSFIRLASSEMARSIATSDGDEAAAIARIETMAVNNGFDPSRITFALCEGNETSLMAGAGSSCTNDDGVLVRGSYVEVFMQMSVDVTPIFTDGLTVQTAHIHSELVDLYRSIPQP